MRFFDGNGVPVNSRMKAAISRFKAARKNKKENNKHQDDSFIDEIDLIDDYDDDDDYDLFDDGDGESK